jgi:hypothetical protein
MNKIMLVAGMLMSFGVSAEALTNPENGQVWITDDNGAYTTDNSRLIKSGDHYFGSDGRIYLRQGSLLMQIGGPRRGQMEQLQRIQIQITAPPIITAPLIVPMHHHHHH